VAVLYINPTTKVLSLSELTHLVTPDIAPLQLFGSMRLGDVVDDAVITRVDPRCGVYFHLQDKLKAFASVCSPCCWIVILTNFMPACAECRAPIDQLISRESLATPNLIID